MPDESADPTAYYDANAEAEWDRLATGIDGRLEFKFTTRELEAVLPDSGRVLDAGGGAGRYAAWLAERGLDVTLADPSRGQLDVARERLAERGVADRVDVHRASVTDLALDANAVDATLCLGGPLSHLLAERDRERAVRELRRVTSPGGPVCVSVMGLLGFVQLQLLTGTHVAALPELLDHGDYDDALLDAHGYENAFTATHFFRRAELVDLLEANGVAVDRVTGLEGLASPFHDEAFRERVADLDNSELDALVETAARTRTDTAVADLSVHLLAVGRA